METTVIIGAGASGLICGHELAKNHHNVIILEQSNKPGRKILASGNGRCNLSNTNLDMYFYNTDDKRIEKIEFGANSWLDISNDKTKLCPVCQNYTPEMRIVCDNPFCPYF